MKRSVAVIFDRFGPYHIARLKAAAEHLDVTAIEVAATTSEYAWDAVDTETSFKRETLFKNVEGDSSNQRPAQIAGRMFEALNDANVEGVFVPGWATVAAQSALSWCLKNGRPAIVMSESTAFDSDRKWHREAIKRRVVSLFSAGLVGGTPQVEYLEKLGLSRERVFTGYDVVDNDFFEGGAKEAQRRNEKGERRLPENYFLASARFIEKKNLPAVIRAYAEYRKKSEIGDWKREVWDLVILGDGPLRPELCSLIADLRLQRSILMPGFKQYDELPGYYARAGAFIHASTSEQWGLVVNEAMASGLPVLVSSRCGCAPDLVRQGKNGFTYDPASIEKLTELMVTLAHLSPDRLREMGEASRGIIAGFTPRHFGEGASQAINAAFRGQMKRGNSLDLLLLDALSYRWV